MCHAITRHYLVEAERDGAGALGEARADVLRGLGVGSDDDRRGRLLRLPRAVAAVSARLGAAATVTASVVATAAATMTAIAASAAAAGGAPAPQHVAQQEAARVALELDEALRVVAVAQLVRVARPAGEQTAYLFTGCPL